MSECLGVPSGQATAQLLQMTGAVELLQARPPRQLPRYDFLDDCALRLAPWSATQLVASGRDEMAGLFPVPRNIETSGEESERTAGAGPGSSRLTIFCDGRIDSHEIRADVAGSKAELRT